MVDFCRHGHVYHAIKDGLYNGSGFVMQLCSFVIATQICTCYMNNQLLQKESILAKIDNDHTHEQTVSLSNRTYYIL